MVAKCGNERVWHWAHKGSRVCDPWWENETEWHRAWKNQFPADWQEIVHHAEDGERHIADVNTLDGWVIEFQHSNIEPAERLSRETFYHSLIWVVDGVRRRRDAVAFARTLATGTSWVPFSNKLRIGTPEGALVRDWREGSAHVFFDFGNGQSLWWLYPGSNSERLYVQQIARAQFLRTLRNTGLREFESLVDNFAAFIAHYESPPPTRSPKRLAVSPSNPTPLPSIRRRYRL